jgi:Amt family ammonium transporter
MAIQGVAVLAAIVYSGTMSFVLLKLIGAIIPLRADAADETSGLDITQHGEEAYVHAGGSSVMMATSTSQILGAPHGLAESHLPAR